ncbi:TetR/AcrR family transcriptional regulator [Nocardiopsis sp. NPDC101807]|uniref:TetR/AcrR family transcriptional regulator n=1 Tax=Nocardiopsis sp. NPDC101807 TaxID=3364339 RepID=UPI003800D7DE
MNHVKTGGKRAEKARLTRLRMLEAARELFVRDGFGATPMQEVADRAGVAVQTLFYTFGTKKALLKQVVDTTIAGDDEPVPTMGRPWFLEAVAEGDARAALDLYVAGAGRVLARVAAVTEMLRIAAATDPAVRTLWGEEAPADPRYTVQLAFAEVFAAKRGAAPGRGAAEAADELYGVLSPELYLVFVRDRGWTHDRWEGWARGVLASRLCAP